jgi:hypothetical protein
MSNQFPWFEAISILIGVVVPFAVVVVAWFTL